MVHDKNHFEALFASDADPWKFGTRWYEARKRALTLACLPARRYASGYEPGCANGELSAALADRCDRLLISDGAAAAVKLACARFEHRSNVSVQQAWLPEEWPEGSFDLIVISELGYYLDRQGVYALAAKASASLSPSGTLLACHWRRPIEGCELDGDEVHLRLAQALALPLLCEVVEADLRIDVWCADARSVGQLEGLA